MSTYLRADCRVSYLKRIMSDLAMKPFELLQFRPCKVRYDKNFGLNFVYRASFQEISEILRGRFYINHQEMSMNHSFLEVEQAIALN